MAFAFLQKLKIPHVFTLLTLVIFGCSLLTYVIPSGSYEREVRDINGTPRNLVIEGTYRPMAKHFSFEGVLKGETVVDKATPVGVHGFLTAIPRGMEKAADIIFFIFVIGGVFGILQRTGVITATIRMLLDVLGDSHIAMTVVIMVVLAIGGSTMGMGEEFIPLVPVFLIVSKKMGYDRIFGLAIVILAAQVGFAAATSNPFTIGVAQGIAGVELLSGKTFRIVFFIVCITTTLIYVLRYAARVKRDPGTSVLGEEGFEIHVAEDKVEVFTSRHAWILIVSALIFGLILFAVSKWHWWMADMGGGFLLIGLIAAAIGKLSLDETALAFVKGMEDMVVAALVVGFARGIEVVMLDGQIMDTVIYTAAALLQEVPRLVAVQGMFLFQSVLNFLIPSGSGQAAVTMPLMAPIADLIGITRQTAVFAFQCGDGFSNTIIPTSGILMSMLSLARIPYDKWLRFMLPLFFQLMILSAIFLVIAVLINYQ